MVSVSGAATDSYLYDGDGNRVKETTYENLAYGLTATSDATLYWPVALTDNDIYANSGSSSSGEFAYTGQSGSHYVQLDLGAVYTVDKIKVWHYYNDGRTYHGVKLQVSDNGTTWTTLYDSAVNGEYAETSAGKTHSFAARSVRYVREYLNGSTANAGNHWVELEVYGSRTTVHIGDYFEAITPAAPLTLPPTPPPPATLSFSGKVANESGIGIPYVDLSLRRQQTCTVPGTGYLQATASVSSYAYKKATLSVYSYTGEHVTNIAHTSCVIISGGCVTFNFPLTALPGGSYQGYVKAVTATGAASYSDVVAFAINHGQTTSQNWDINLQQSFPPAVNPVNPLPWTGETSVTNTNINSTQSAANGDYRLNYASPTCPSGCSCTLHIDETVPADYTAVGASAPSPGVVVSNTEIRYPWASSGSYANNNFTLRWVSTLPEGATWRRYYYAGGTRVAMREGSGTGTSGLKWLLGDHLGSTAITAEGSTGAKVAELRFKPWGELRYAWELTPTDRRYTGQRAEGIGLYDYRARFYDPQLGRFNQPDSLVPNPGNTIDFDRYAFARNNPLRYVDPSGHWVQESPGNVNLSNFRPLVLLNGFAYSERRVIEAVATKAATKYAEILNKERGYWARKLGDDLPTISPEDAFYGIHGGPVSFTRVAESCDGNGGGCGGETLSKNEILIYNNVSARYVTTHPGFIAHELGHAFNNATGDLAQIIPWRLMRPLAIDGIDVPGNTIWKIDHGNKKNGYYGYFGGWDVWQFGYSSALPGSEEWADMFVGWLYGQWEISLLGIDRRSYMNIQMRLFMLSTYSR